MFQKEDVFSGNYTYHAANADGTIITRTDRERIVIVDVKDDVFTAKIFFNFDSDKNIYNASSLAMGIYNKEKNTFRMLDTLNDTPLTNPNFIELSLTKGKHTGKAIHLELLESSNIPQLPRDSLFFSFQATLKKRY